MATLFNDIARIEESNERPKNVNHELDKVKLGERLQQNTGSMFNVLPEADYV